VTWQDELRRLDDELAAGRLSAEDYRRQRDDLLSQTASGGPPVRPVAKRFGDPDPDADDQPAQPLRPPLPPSTPVPQQRQAGPFPPPFRWDETPESTQVMGTVRDDAGTASDSTADSPDGADAERTQVVPGAPGPPVPPRRPSQAAPYWQQGEHTPSWASADLPPTTDITPAWYKQGPEFETTDGQRRGWRIFIMVAVLLLIVGATASTFYVVRNRSNGEPAAQQTTQPATGPASTAAPTPTTPPRQPSPIEAVFEKMPQPPGEQDADNGVLSLAKVAELKLLSPAEVKILQDARVEQVAYRGSIKGQDEYSPYPDAFETLTFITADPSAANSIANKLRAHQEQNGLVHIPEPLPDMPPSVVFEKRVGQGRSIYRGLYVSGSNVVRVNVVQEPLKDEAALSGSYQRHMQQLIRVFGPGR